MGIAISPTRRHAEVSRPVFSLKAEPIVREAELIPAILLEAGSAQLPALRIGLVDSFAGTAGPAFIKNMIDAATQLAVWTGLSPSQGQALLSRQVDVIITSDMIEDVDGLDRPILWREPFVLIIPKDRDIPKDGPDLRQLAAEMPLIRFSARSQLGSQIDRHLRRTGVVAHRRLEIDISDTVTAMVAAGIGWAITTPLCLLQGRSYPEQVSVVPLPGPRVTRRLAVALGNTGTSRPGSFMRHARLSRRDVSRRSTVDGHGWMAKSRTTET
ncbi:MAG: LysR family transcriptional regulator [Microvirga sp.]|jgi:DNA-binding transcriptional LysR family regulator|nr:LysR family transcriptional regulator [Microvirga sp.]